MNAVFLMGEKTERHKAITYCMLSLPFVKFLRLTLKQLIVYAHKENTITHVTQLH